MVFFHCKSICLFPARSARLELHSGLHESLDSIFCAVTFSRSRTSQTVVYYWLHTIGLFVYYLTWGESSSGWDGFSRNWAAPKYLPQDPK